MSDVVRVDPHVKILDDSIVERAARAGLDALVYAPHFERLPEIEAAAETHSTDDLLVAPAREVFTGTYQNRKHVLALDLEEPVPDFVTLDAAMAEFERQDATVLAPHPEFFTVGLEAADLREYRETIDAIEVRNPKHWPHHDRRARQLAVDLDLPVYGSSYAHLPWTIGDVWTEFEPAVRSGSRSHADVAANGAGDVVVPDGSPAAPGAPASPDAEARDAEDAEVEPGDAETAEVEPGDAETAEVEPGDAEAAEVEPGDAEAAAVEPGDATASAPSDREADEGAGITVDAASLADAVATRERHVRHRSGLGRVARGVAECSHLLYENSWKKFDRVWLSGTEATHPHHPAYDGRFDDSFVY